MQLTAMQSGPGPKSYRTRGEPQQALTVSVVITSYNQREQLREAIESVLNQTEAPDQIVIADDASVDGSQALIEDYALRYGDLITPVLAEVNQHVSRNRNAGIRAATGSLITWLDGDDIFLPRKIEMEKAALDTHRDAGWAFSQVNVLHTDSGRAYKRYNCSFDENAFLVITGMIGREPRNPMVRSTVLERIGLFDEHMTLYEDLDLILRLAHENRCRYIDHPNMEYRVHGGGLHNTDWDEFKRNYSLLKANLAELIACDPHERKRQALLSFKYQAELDLSRAARQSDHLFRSIAHRLAAIYYSWMPRVGSRF